MLEETNILDRQQESEILWLLAEAKFELGMENQSPSPARRHNTNGQYLRLWVEALMTWKVCLKYLRCR